MKDLRQAIEDFLTAMSRPPPPTHCPLCHFPVENKYATFFFYDSEQSWTIPISICRNCERRAKES